MKELLQNAEDFLQSGNENLVKGRFNVSVSDFFKAIAIFCDYLIYKDVKILPKNHNERFYILHMHFKEIYLNVSEIFKKYTESYSLRLKKEDAEEIRSYAYELKNFITGKKETE